MHAGDRTAGSVHGERLVIPDDYRPFLDLRDTEKAIKWIKHGFQEKIAAELNLSRVSAPIVVPSGSGINDSLTGRERPIEFGVTDLNLRAEIVQSLAKWKRAALADYGFERGEGLYTDMNALRPDETLDNLHSIYVDQWDWEVVIGPEDRSLDFLRSTVTRIYRSIREMEAQICARYPGLPAPYLPDEIRFIHSEELAASLPRLDPLEREDEVCRESGAVFLVGIGAELGDGRPHDERAADYDDWITETGEGKRGLNGDILVWYPLLGRAMELSSMGIRVSSESLLRQLEAKGEMEKRELYFHRRLLEGELPQSIGGGIGQSRLCMLFLRKAHIGEVQSSIWPEAVKRSCAEGNVPLL